MKYDNNEITLIEKVNLINYIASKLGRRVDHGRALLIASRLSDNQVNRLAFIVKTGTLKV